MSTKRDLDETDVVIVQLLADDGRRSFSDIADAVGLSPPAVSDRIDRLREQGVIRRFTIDIDRQKLQRRIPVLVEFAVQPAHTADIYQSVRDLDGIEHVFKTYDGTVIAYGTAPENEFDEWIHENIDLEHVTEFDIQLVDRYDWSVDVDDSEFALTCPVCGNTVTSGGVTADVDGETKTFCCPSCRADYVERYESHRSNA